MRMSGRGGGGPVERGSQPAEDRRPREPSNKSQRGQPTLAAVTICKEVFTKSNISWCAIAT